MLEHPWFGPGAAELELEVRKRVKDELRTKLRKQRGALPEEARRARSERIAQAVLALPEWRDARTVASFRPMRKEVDVGALAEAARAQGKRLALPRVDRRSDALVFSVVDGTTSLETSPFGVEEPSPDSPPLDPAEIDLVVVPALAFDERGFRLGYGKGYYDRFLAGIRAATVGVAYDFEMLAELPTMEWDVAVRIIVTDARAHRVE